MTQRAGWPALQLRSAAATPRPIAPIAERRFGFEPRDHGALRRDTIAHGKSGDGTGVRNIGDCNNPDHGLHAIRSHPHGANQEKHPRKFQCRSFRLSAPLVSHRPVQAIPPLDQAAESCVEPDPIGTVG